MPVQYFAQVVPSIDALAAAFASRLTRPFDEGDASTDAEVSVMSNVAMGYFNQSQIPIPWGTSAAACVEILLEKSAREQATLDIRLHTPFVGRDDRWSDRPTNCETPSPFTLLEPTEESSVRAYRFHRDEWTQRLDNAVIERVERFTDKTTRAPLVLAWSQEMWDPFGVANDFESEDLTEVPDIEQ